MREVVFFRLECYGGMEGKTVVTRNYETEEMAREYAMGNTYNSDFSLYRVTMIFDKTISEKKEYLGRIPCGRDIQMMTRTQERIDRMLNEIEMQKNNKRIKETTRAKRIKDIKQRIEWEKQNIESIKKMFDKVAKRCYN